MLEILQFIFASGWHFFGVLLILIVIMGGLAAAFGRN